jgi:hypothetical protein
VWVCEGVGGVGGVWEVWWCGGCGGGCVGCGGSPLALEHSKVCTLCDFGHLQFYYYYYYYYLGIARNHQFDCRANASIAR